MDHQRDSPDPTSAFTYDNEDIYREDDAFGSLTAVGSDEDNEEYEATQQLLRSHATSSSDAAVEEVIPSPHPTGDDNDSVASTEKISITVEGAVRKRRFSRGDSAPKDTSSSELEDDDDNIVMDDDGDDSYGHAAAAGKEPANSSYLEESGDESDDDDKKPAATVPTSSDVSKGDQEDCDMPTNESNGDEIDPRIGSLYSTVAVCMMSLYIDLAAVDEKEAEMQQRIYDGIKAAAPTIGKDEWTCPICTVTNDNIDALACFVCNSQRIESNEPTEPPMSGMLEDDSIEIRPKLASGETYGDNDDDRWILFDRDKHICFGWGIGTPRGDICYIRYVGKDNDESLEVEWRKTQRRGRSRTAWEKQAVGEGNGKSPEKTVSELQAEEYFSPKKRRKRATPHDSSCIVPRSPKGRKKHGQSSAQKKSPGGVSSGNDSRSGAANASVPLHESTRQGESTVSKSPSSGSSNAIVAESQAAIAVSSSTDEDIVSADDADESGDDSDDSSDDHDHSDVEEDDCRDNACDTSTSWSCRSCHFLHEKKAAGFLACEMCRAPREETNVGALLSETGCDTVPPRISFDCPPLPPEKPPPFPLDGKETIEAFMHPNGNLNKEPEWTIVSRDHHLCHEKSFDHGKMSGTCTMSWVRQGDPRPFTTRWRVCKGRASRGTAPLFLSAEQTDNIVRKSRPNMKKRVVDEGSNKGSSGSISAVSSTKRQRKDKNLHYLEERLGMSMDEIDKVMPKALATEVHDCVWCPWKASDGTVIYHPALILRPADLSGETDALKLVGAMIKKAIQTNRFEHWNKHLVFWYSSGYSWAKKGAHRHYKAFTLEAPENLVPYSVGVENGYHRPKFLMKKINSPTLLSWKEAAFSDGLKQMEKDAKVEKGQRGGPFFFEDQRQFLRDKAKELEGEREGRIEKERKEKAAKRDERRMEERKISEEYFTSRFVDDDLCSLELCSGKAKLSAGLQMAGFRLTVTMDNDPKKDSVSNLSLQQLEDIIEGRNGDRRWRHHPTHKCFNAIWAGPCCTTYSNAQSTKIYRTEEFIYGIPGSVTEAEAREADDNIDSLVEILLEFQSINRFHRRAPPIICIENPDGYLPKHPISNRFIRELGLEALRISYCKFGTEENPLPQKNTVLWTNSSSLIASFKDGKYSCKNDCICRTASGRHRVGVQDYRDRCSAYPDEMVAFISSKIESDAREKASTNTK